VTGRSSCDGYPWASSHPCGSMPSQPGAKRAPIRPEIETERRRHQDFGARNTISVLPNQGCCLLLGRPLAVTRKSEFGLTGPVNGACGVCCLLTTRSIGAGTNAGGSRAARSLPPDHMFVILVMRHIQIACQSVSASLPHHPPASPAGLRSPVAVVRPIGVGRASSGMSWRRPLFSRDRD